MDILATADDSPRRASMDESSRPGIFDPVMTGDCVAIARVGCLFSAHERMEKPSVKPVAENGRQARFFEMSITRMVGCKYLLNLPQGYTSDKTETYDNPEFYEWFLQHRKQPANVDSE